MFVFLQRWIGWIFLLLFLIFFFPKWYVYTYTKIWEMRQMMGKPWESQLVRLHPADQMGQLFALRSHLEQGFVGQEISLVFPRERSLGLSQNPAIVRAILHSDLFTLRYVNEETEKSEPCFLLLSAEQISHSAFSQNTCQIWSMQ